MTSLIENLCFDKKIFPGGCLPLPLDYIHIYDHYFKHLLWKHCAKCNESQILFGATFGRREKSLFKFSRTHGQDGCHAHIWWKLLKKFCSRTKSPMILKLGMQHVGLKFHRIQINDDPGLPLTYFFYKVKFCCLCIWIGKTYKVF